MPLKTRAACSIWFERQEYNSGFVAENNGPGMAWKCLLAQHSWLTGLGGGTVVPWLWQPGEGASGAAAVSPKAAVPSEGLANVTPNSKTATICDIDRTLSNRTLSNRTLTSALLPCLSP